MYPATKRPSSRPDPDTALPDAVRWRILAVLLLAMFMSLVGVSIVNVALPSIQQALDASHADIQWVLSGYALTFGIVLVAAGRAGDIMGRGGIFLWGVGLFTVASLAAGLAPDATWLNAARFAQGLGSGLLSPQGMGMIQQYFRGAERGRAFGYLGTTVGFSVAIGPVMGGFFIEAGGLDLGWRLTFLVNIPVGILTFVLGWRWFPRPLMRRMASLERHPSNATLRQALLSLDPLGSLLLGLAVLAVLFPFVEARSSPVTWWLLPIAGMLTLLWIRWERYYENIGHSPMVNLDIFSVPSFTNGILIMALYFLGMTSIWVLVALYVQMGKGMTALQSGMFGIPSALLSAYAADWAGRRVMKYGRKIVIGGLMLGIAGMLLSVVVVFLAEARLINIWWLTASLGLVGLAQGSVISPNQTLTLAEVPLDYAGSSGAIMQTGQRIGTSVGIAVITAAVFAVLAVGSWSIAVAIGFGLIALIMFVALLIAIKDQRQRNQLHINHQGAGQ